MITVHEKTATAFDTLGMGTLFPSSCFVTEELNGLFELEMVHPYDDKGKWKRLEVGNIVVASTPRGKQAFRIYRLQPTMNSISVFARHIFYDLLDNYIIACTVESGTAQQILNNIVENFNYTMPFSFVADLAGTNSFSVSNCNPVSALLGDGNENDSIVMKYGGEILRDNFSVQVLSSIGIDKGVSIRYSKNLTGLTVDEDVSEVVTRIFPFGKDGLKGEVVDSPYISNYQYPKTAKVENTECTTTAQLANYAQELFGLGVDLPKVNIQVNFQLLNKTAEYKNYAVLEDVQLGDVVTVINNKMGFHKKAKVISYRWDALLEKYEIVELGDFMPTLATSVTSGVRGENLASNAYVEASAVMATLQSHLNNFQNPHRVTAAQTGSSSGGGEDINTVQQNLNAHINNKENPHGVTSEQVGAYTKEEIDTKLQSLPSNGTIVSYGTTQPNDADGQDGDVYIKLDESTEYTQVEYIESSGTQYIDTGFKHNQNTRVVMSAKVVTQPSTHAWLFEGRNATGVAHKSVFLQRGTAWKADYSLGSGSGRASISSVGVTDRLTIDYNKNTIKVNSFTHTWTATTFQSDYNLTLFAANTAGAVDGFISAEMNMCKIYDNDVLIRDYIPVKDPSGVACLYDKVSQTYFYNAGTGAFTAGAELPKEISGGALYIKINGTWKLVMKGA